ncbi:MAG: hypothetical protein ABL900_04570 [Burkholderiaceae bacterium]
MARAAMAPQGAAAAARTAPAAPAEIQASPNLRYFSESASSTGSIAFNLGDRFVGPGPLTVGTVGAKKQVILPAGEWVLIAAADSKSNQAPAIVNIPLPNRVDLTTLVFARFSGERVQSMLRFTSNFRPATVPSWSDLDGCDVADPPHLHHARTKPTPFRDECLAIRGIADPMADASAAMDEARRSLKRIGASASGAAIATILSYGEGKRYGYAGITRLDWPALALGDDADAAQAWRPDSVAASAARGAYIKTLTAWAEAYRPHAREGYWQSFDAPELIAGATAAPAKGPKIEDFTPRSPVGAASK